jgi:uncharacterized protein YoxC
MGKRSWLRIAEAPRFWAIEPLAREVHRLRMQIDFLDEENRDLRRRFAFLAQDLEQARAKVTTVLRNLQGLLDRVKAMETRMREDSFT